MSKASVAKKAKRDRRIEDAMRTSIHIIKKSNKTPRVHDIRRIIAQSFGLTLDEFMCRSRAEKYTIPRQFAMAVAREMTERSLVFMGDFFERDYTTITHAYDKYGGKVRALLSGEDYSISKPAQTKTSRPVTNSWNTTWDWRRRRCHTHHAVQLKLMSSLAALIEWSVDGGYSTPVDVFPMFNALRAGNIFKTLHRLGYAEWTTFDECNSRDKWWRVTDEGRHAYERLVFVHELRREFGLLGGGTAVRSSSAVGNPDRSGSRAVRDALVAA